MDKVDLRVMSRMCGYLEHSHIHAYKNEKEVKAENKQQVAPITVGPHVVYNKVCKKNSKHLVK